MQQIKYGMLKTAELDNIQFNSGIIVVIVVVVLESTPTNSRVLLYDTKG